jgi:tRNA pseudouridine55 synthase
MGHGGTLDPFATGLLLVCIGRGVKLARYFLGSDKEYVGDIRFGQTTVPGDPTAPISETSSHLPESIESIREMTQTFTRQPYLQTPPMFSAKKRDGKPLYELARLGIEVERKVKSCTIYQFDIPAYEKPVATFKVRCSSGTYIRTLSQDFGQKLGTVAMLDSLRRTSSGAFQIQNATTLEELAQDSSLGCDPTLSKAWIPFDELPKGFGDVFDRAEATALEATHLIQGQQGVLPQILERSDKIKDCVAIFSDSRFIAVARKEGELWGIERVFT